MMFKAPWLRDDGPRAAPSAEAVPTCKFITSFGGAAHCQDPVYMIGFCEFHFDAFENGEISEEGRISDRLDDQTRRREINFHAVQLAENAKPLL